MVKPALLLAYEAEANCRARLIAEGFGEKAAREISSYLDQSTDIAGELADLEAACARRGMSFRAVELDGLQDAIAQTDPATTLVWTLTDGIAYFRGSTAPSIARLSGIATFGSDDALFALCQDKFRSGAVLRALGLPCPPAALARNGVWIVPPPHSNTGWFVKPNRLGAKIGIWADSHVQDLDHALEISRRAFEAYRDDVVVQPYVAGRNVRASYLDIGARTQPGVSFVASGSDFQTMEDSLALYGESGEAAKASGDYLEPQLVPVSAQQPGADAAIRTIIAAAMRGLGLRDVWSMDFRVEADDTVHLIEFEVCPGLPCFDFRAYCREQYGLSLVEAMAEAASRRLSKRN